MNKRKTRRSRAWLLFFMFILLATSASLVGAQEPITLNETKIGQISAEVPEPFYNFTAQAGQSVRIEIIGTAEGLAPQFAILTSAGAMVQAIGNPGLTLTVDSTVTFPQAGLYLIQVSSATNTTGQFVLQLSEGAPPAPAIPLSQAQTMVGQVAPGERVTYNLSGSPQFALDLIVMATATGGVEVTLRDGAGTVIGMLGRGLTGGQFGLPVGQAAYRLELAHDGSNPGIVAYQLLLTSSGNAPVQPAVPAPVTTAETAPPATATTESGGLPPLPESGACVVATATGVNVNIRAATTTDAAILGRMDPQTVYNATGINPERSWYQIQFGGGVGWVALSVTRTGGTCISLPVVSPPPTAPAPPPTETIDAPQPGPAPTLSVSALDLLCRTTYFNGAAQINLNDRTCYTCPTPFTIAGRELGSSALRCSGPATAFATRHGAATGIIGTDCPAGSGQFWDPNGFCYTCPLGYDRSTAPVDSDGACHRNNSAAPAPILLGSLAQN